LIFPFLFTKGVENLGGTENQETSWSLLLEGGVKNPLSLLVAFSKLNLAGKILQM